MSIDLHGKVCVVTGAARSIGLAVSEMYSGLGARVAMIDTNPQVKDHAARHEVRGYIVDISDKDAVFRCFDEIARELGNVFCLVNNAGVVSQTPFEEIQPDELDRITRVTINGSVFCAQAALRTMRSWKDGRIINFSSKSGKTGSALMAAYSAAKGAIIALTQAMAHELSRDNIKVNCLCPGIVEKSGVWDSVSRGYVENLHMTEEMVEKQFTAKVPLGRLCRIEDVVAFVRFLTLDGDYCTGQAFNISGGREMH